MTHAEYFYSSSVPEENIGPSPLAEGLKISCRQIANNKSYNQIYGVPRALDLTSTADVLKPFYLNESLHYDTAAHVKIWGVIMQGNPTEPLTNYRVHGRPGWTRLFKFKYDFDLRSRRKNFTAQQKFNSLYADTADASYLRTEISFKMPTF